MWKVIVAMVALVLAAIVLPPVIGVEVPHLAHALVLLFVLVGAFVLYFLPTMIAYRRGHRNLAGAFVVNLIFGLTVLGGIAALAWAMWIERPTTIVVHAAAEASRLEPVAMRLPAASNI